MKINKCGSYLDYNDDYFCLLSKIGSACFGDSGGPMICEENDKVVFYGVASAVTDPVVGSCRENFVNIYASVYQHIELIESTLVRFFSFTTIFIIDYNNFMLIQKKDATYCNGKIHSKFSRLGDGDCDNSLNNKENCFDGGDCESKL